MGLPVFVGGVAVLTGIRVATLCALSVARYSEAATEAEGTAAVPDLPALAAWAVE